jgi:hypothetical protein
LVLVSLYHREGNEQMKAPPPQQPRIPPLVAVLLSLLVSLLWPTFTNCEAAAARKLVPAAADEETVQLVAQEHVSRGNGDEYDVEVLRAPELSHYRVRIRFKLFNGVPY